MSSLERESKPIEAGQEGREKSERQEKLARAKAILQEMAEEVERIFRDSGGQVDQETAVANYPGFKQTMRRMAGQLDEIAEFLRKVIPAAELSSLVADSNWSLIAEAKRRLDEFKYVRGASASEELKQEWADLCREFFDGVKKLPDVFSRHFGLEVKGEEHPNEDEPE